MAQLIPVDHDPFDMAASLAAAGGDPLVPPPRNPMAPPQGLVDALSGAVKKNLDWASVPGRVARGVEPETPGQWSEEDEFRRQHLASSPYEWGPQTAFGEVFWPRTGTNVGGSGFNVGSGAIIPPKQGIRAYHGSPHDFDRFDLSKIGTGEGAQSYGHGLYFAENPKVAEAYKFDPRMALGAHGNKFSPIEEEAARRFYGNKSNTELALADIEGRIKNSRMYGDSAASVARLTAARDLLQRGWSPPVPRMYEVNINAKPEQFLDWDRPLAADHPARQAAAEVLKPPGMFTFEPERTLRDTRRDRINEPMATGADIYQTVSRGLAAGKGFKPSEATSVMREAGIPGIKYLDQGSRLNTTWIARHPQGGINDFPSEQAARAFIARNPEHTLEAPKNTSNYVVFDDKIIDILHKYGIGGLSMLPPAVAAHIQSRLIPVDHDPFAQ